MDFEDSPHFDRDLIGPDGRFARLHKGGKAKKPAAVPQAVSPAMKGESATNLDTAKERDPNKRTRGQGSTILSTGVKTGFGSTSILGG